MERLFFQSQPHRPAHIHYEISVAPSPHPEIQLWGPCHSHYERMNDQARAKKFAEGGICTDDVPLFRIQACAQTASLKRLRG